MWKEWSNAKQRPDLLPEVDASSGDAVSAGSNFFVKPVGHRSYGRILLIAAQRIADEISDLGSIPYSCANAYASALCQAFRNYSSR